MSKVFVEERGNNLIFYNEEEYMELDFIEAKIEDKYNYFFEDSIIADNKISLYTKEEILKEVNDLVSIDNDYISLYKSIENFRDNNYDFVILTNRFGLVAIAVLEESKDNEDKYKLINVLE